MYSKSIIISGTRSDLNQSFPTIHLDSHLDYFLALVSLDFYYCVPNITDDNNQFKYSLDNGQTWSVIKIDKGYYLLKDLYNEIIELLNLNYIPFTITSCKSRVSTIIKFQDPNFQIDFKSKGTFGDLLGFKHILNPKEGNIFESNYPIRILPINQIFITCDVVEQSIVNNKHETFIYNFFPNCLPGDKLIEKPNNLIFHKIIKRSIHQIHFKLVDENGKLIDLNKETVTINLLIKSFE